MTDGTVERVSVIDCTNGKPLFKGNRQLLAQLLRIDFPVPFRVAIAPNDGRLILCAGSATYGRNGFVVDPTYKKLQSSFHIDAYPREISVALVDDRIAVVAEKEVLCLHNLSTDRDEFFRGQRITKGSQAVSIAIDSPFFSHLRDSGSETIVYTRDNSWGTGKVFVHNMKTKKVKTFDARNGHIELDVSFSKKRVALTGTSTNLTLLNFDGNTLAEKKKATLQRNACVEFSPDGKRLLIGSWDNTLSVFSLRE